MKFETLLLRATPMTMLGVAILSTMACGDIASGVYLDAGVPAPAANGEVYDEIVENDFIDASVENTSTFSIDVDTASYTVMRRDIESGVLPQPESVRPEEYINYFDYQYPEPEGDAPFSIDMEVAPSKFGDEGAHLLRVGLKGKAMTLEDLKPTNLVFLVDVSGSMNSEEKLPLVEQSLETLVENLRPTDTISIITYAGRDRVLLEPTKVRRGRKIQRAIDSLDRRLGGSTNAEAGIERAYEFAEDAKIEGGNNRVVILTDGDFNVGRTGDALFELIEEYRAREISLTAVGYGLGNYNDYHMENLSNRGNGNYFYVDSIDEARRVFGTELASTLEVIAADVKVQVEFNAEVVERYRLLGYENRVLDNQDFDDDAVDAGEIGPGHTVTAFYEIELAEQARDEDLLSTVRLRYKAQYGEQSELLERGVKLRGAHEAFADASDDFRFGAAVAEYAEVLRGSMHVDQPDLDEVERVAADASRGTSKEVEFLGLLSAAKGMMP